MNHPQTPSLSVSPFGKSFARLRSTAFRPVRVRVTRIEVEETTPALKVRQGRKWVHSRLGPTHNLRTHQTRQDLNANAVDLPWELRSRLSGVLLSRDLLSAPSCLSLLPQAIWEPLHRNSRRLAAIVLVAGDTAIYFRNRQRNFRRAHLIHTTRCLQEIACTTGTTETCLRPMHHGNIITKLQL